MKHTHYSIPSAGTILPGQRNEYVMNPGAGAGLEQRVQWDQATAQAEAFRLTELRAMEDLNDFNQRWLVNYRSGRMMGPKGEGDPDAPTPTPRAAVVVKVIAVEPDADASGVRFDLIDSPDVPCCVWPEYERITAPQHYVKKAKR